MTTQRQIHEDTVALQRISEYVDILNHRAEAVPLVYGSFGISCAPTMTPVRGKVTGGIYTLTFYAPPYNDDYKLLETDSPMDIEQMLDAIRIVLTCGSRGPK